MRLLWLNLPKIVVSSFWKEMKKSSKFKMLIRKYLPSKLFKTSPSHQTLKEWELSSKKRNMMALTAELFFISKVLKLL
jgi:hypothetical protein